GVYLAHGRGVVEDGTWRNRELDALRSGESKNRRNVGDAELRRGRGLNRGADTGESERDAIDGGGGRGGTGPGGENCEIQQNFLARGENAHVGRVVKEPLHIGEALVVDEERKGIGREGDVDSVAERKVCTDDAAGGRRDVVGRDDGELLRGGDGRSDDD